MSWKIESRDIRLSFTLIGLFILYHNELTTNNLVAAADTENLKTKTNEEIRENSDKISCLKDNVTVIDKQSKDLINILENTLPKSGQLVPPSSKDINTMKIVYNKIKEIQDNVSRLNSDLSGTVGDLASVKGRISNLEQDLENVNKQIDNERRKTNQMFSQYESTLQNISSSCNNIIDKLTNRFKDMERQDEEKPKYGCVAAILDKDYYSAANIIDYIPDSNIEFIVTEVCNKSNNNFTSLFVFSDFVSNLDKKYLIFKALTHELINRNINDESPFVILTELINDQLIFCRSKLFGASFLLIDQLLPHIDSIRLNLGRKLAFCTWY